MDFDEVRELASKGFVEEAISRLGEEIAKGNKKAHKEMANILMMVFQRTGDDIFLKQAMIHADECGDDCKEEKAQIYLYKGEIAKAEEIAKEIDDKSKRAYVEAIISLTKGDEDTALNILESSPKDIPEIFLILSIIYGNKGMYKKMIEVLEEGWKKTHNKDIKAELDKFKILSTTKDLSLVEGIFAFNDTGHPILESLDRFSAVDNNEYIELIGFGISQDGKRIALVLPNSENASLVVEDIFNKLPFDITPKKYEIMLKQMGIYDKIKDKK